MFDFLERLIIETQSIVLRPGMADIWTRLRGKELRMALCSNLASGYPPNASPDRARGR